MYFLYLWLVSAVCFCFFLSCFVYSFFLCVHSFQFNRCYFLRMLTDLVEPNSSQFNEKSVHDLQRGNAGRGERVKWRLWRPFHLANDNDSQFMLFPLPNVYCFVLSLVFHKLAEKQKCLMQFRKKTWFTGSLQMSRWDQRNEKNFFQTPICFGCNFFWPNQGMAIYKW